MKLITTREDLSDVFCKTCGHTGKPDNRREGSTGVELILWLMFLIPGLIYSVWRDSTMHDVCQRCGKDNIIPADSPMAKAS